MLSLYDLQRCFKDLILNEQGSEVDLCIQKNGLTARRRLNIYQNNCFETLTETLKSIYPTVLRLVGDDFFDYAANHYIKNNPSTSGDLAHFGKPFDGFLADFTPAKGLVYLPEIAQLDWAYHEVFHAAFHAPCNIQDLHALSQDDYGKIKFKLHPASTLLSFQFPILKIWQICQDDSNNEQINLDMGGDHLLVIRRKLSVQFEKLSASEFAFLSALNQGLTFEKACVLGLEEESSCDINNYLQRHLLNETIVNFTL